MHMGKGKTRHHEYGDFISVTLCGAKKKKKMTLFMFLFTARIKKKKE